MILFKILVYCVYVKHNILLAAKKHMTISELLLSSVREKMPRRKEPNAETIEALKESREGQLKSNETLDEFWKTMGIDPNASTNSHFKS